MILDSGICTIVRKQNIARAGAMPVYRDVFLYRGWYGEMSFETAPVWPTDGREEIQTDARIRILQNRRIGQHDRVKLEPQGQEAQLYEVKRAYHGSDTDSGELITDLTLTAVEGLWMTNDPQTDPEPTTPAATEESGGDGD